MTGPLPPPLLMAASLSRKENGSLYNPTRLHCRVVLVPCKKVPEQHLSSGKNINKNVFFVTIFLIKKKKNAIVDVQGEDGADQAGGDGDGETVRGMPDRHIPRPRGPVGGRLQQVQGYQLYMAVYFWFPCKKWFVHSSRVQYRTLEKSLFTRYQNNTAMFIW